MSLANTKKPSQGNPQDVLLCLLYESVVPQPKVNTIICMIFTTLYLVNDITITYNFFVLIAKINISRHHQSIPA